MMATADGEGKKNYYKWSKEDLERALSAYDKKEMGINAISRQYQVPKATILRHAKLLNKFANHDNTHKGRPTIFSVEQEQQLVDHLLLLESHMFGLTVRDVRRLAYQIAEYNKIPHSFNKEKRAASKRWFYAFKKRHPEISIRQPENTSLNRVKGFNRENVSGFYDLLEKIVDDNSIQASNIFNVDETGISTVQKKAQKVVGLKGKKQIGSVTSGERGVNTTAVCCASATGQFVPVMLIFKRKRQCPELADGAPADSVVTISDTGYINSALFVEWLKHFIAIVKPTQDKKVILLLDGHTTHTRNLEALILARENGIIMVQLPGHTTHRLQPLDVSFFKPLNTYYVQAVEKWLRTNPGRQVTQYQIARLFGEAYERAATISNVTNGFRTAGIWPVDRNVFPSHLFEAADVLNENQSESRDELIPAATSSTKEKDNDKNQPNNIIEPQPSTSTRNITKSLSILSPVPKSKGNKKRAVQKATEITASPYKTSLEENIQRKEKSGKGKKQMNKASKTYKGKKQKATKVSKSMKKEVVKKCMKRKRSLSSSSSDSNVAIELNDDDDDEDDENVCASCGLNYYDKRGPQVEWLQCVRCKSWLHETCTTNPDICDDCLN